MRKILLSLSFLIALTGITHAAFIDVNTADKTLTFYDDNGEIITYPIGVARRGFEWTGTNPVTRKVEWPNWRPSKAMRARRPELPAFVPGGADNPLGARALYLGNTLYRIHGSNEPETIGMAVSSGCIRMNNDDIIDLYDRVPIGTIVTVR